MITLSKSGNTITFTFDENSGYLQNGTIDVPINSLSLVMDESDMATFRKSASNDIFVSARYEEFGMTKAELEQFYKNNMVGSTGGGGGITSGEVQTMIDESISGKVDTSTYNTYTAATNTALSGKQNTLIAGDSIKLVATYEGDEINTFYRGWGDFQQYDFRPSGSFYVVVGFDCAGSTNGSARFEFEVDNETKAVTIEFDSSTESWHCNSWDDPQICDDLWQYLNISYGGNGTFYVEPYVEVTVNDDGCARFAYDLEYAGTTTDALDAVFGNLENKADKWDAVHSAEYVSSSTTINFKNVEGTIISYINASDFIVDGMVEDVRIDTISGVSYLVIDFNTASGKQDIQIPLTDIFDPSNYYTKSEIDAALSGKADTTAVTEAISAATSGKVDNDTYTAYTASTDARIAEDEEVTAEALNVLNEGLSGKVDTTTYTAYTASTDAALSGKADTSAVTEAISEATSGLQETLVSGTNIKTINNESILGSGNITIQGGGGVDSGTVQTMIDESISGKVDTSSVVTAVTSASTDSEIPTAKAVFDAIPSGGTGGGGMTEDDELLLATALTDLNDRKIDTSEVKANYQRKGDYATKTYVTTALEPYETKLDEINTEEVTAYALNDLNERFGGLKLVKITQSEYAALTTKDENTLYVVVADPT